MPQTDTSRILEGYEVLACLAWMRAKAAPGKRKRPSKMAELNMIVFRLSSAYGLRRKEIVGLNMGDITLSGSRPSIHIRAAITKASSTGQRHGRRVRLRWDRFAMADVAAWYQRRIAMGAQPTDPFVCSLSGKKTGERLSWDNVRHHWRTALTPLGEDRANQVSIHQGRHSFCSHAIATGRSLSQVRDAAGHASVGTTNIYAHALANDDDFRDLYGSDQA